MSEREENFLEDLLVTPPSDLDDAMTAAREATIAERTAPLTREDERALLRAANDAGPVTLVDDHPATAESASSLVQDVAGFVRRYPLQTALAAAGAAYLLARRRRH